MDPITLEVIKNALSSVADEMALVLMRSAYSPVVRDSMDYSTALCDRHGQVIAQGLTLAVQLGAFPDAMQHLTAKYKGRMQPGDIFIMNDPYGAGGQHLPDIYVIQPIFWEGEVEGYACTMAHHSDVGGIAPGSVAIHATDIYQEGLRLPMLKLYEAGTPNQTLFEIIEKNTRQPVQVLGDLRAQLAACAIAERGYTALLKRYGGKSVRPYLEAIMDQAERLMREFIRGIPDGEYRFTDWIDGLGESPGPLKIAVCVTVRGDEIEVDFTGTSSQVPGAINCRSRWRAHRLIAPSAASRVRIFRTARATCGRCASRRQRARSSIRYCQRPAPRAASWATACSTPSWARCRRSCRSV
jgi:N-methylhydantoinase B